LEECFKQTSKFVADIGRNVWIAEFYFVKELRSAFGVERWETNNHLVDKGAETPPINWFSMSLFIKYLRSKVFWGSTDRESGAIGDVHFGESEICEPEIAS